MLEFHTLDVFTDRAFAGNPLAVVLGADGLSPAQMQTIAREFNLSETIFVQAPRNPAHTARVRIFFPTAEIPFAGHPTVGCAIHLATKAARAGDFSADLVLEEEAGLVPVTVTRRGDAVEAEFAAPVLPHAAAGAVLTEALAPALGLLPGDIGFGAHRPAVWQGGPAFLYVPLASLDSLARARPIQPHWDAVMQAAGGGQRLSLHGRAGLRCPRADVFAHRRHPRRPRHRIGQRHFGGAVASIRCVERQ